MQRITTVSSANGIQDICGRATYNRRTCHTRYVRWNEKLLLKKYSLYSQTTLINAAESPKVHSDAPIHY